MEKRILVSFLAFVSLIVTTLLSACMKPDNDSSKSDSSKIVAESYYQGANRIGAGDFEKPDLFKIDNISDGSHSYSLKIAGQGAGSGTVTVTGGETSIGSTLTALGWNSISDNTITIELTIGESTFSNTTTKEQYSIKSWQDLQGVKYNLVGDYTLMNSIALPEPSTEDSFPNGLPAAGFEPLGADGAAFTGSFNGQSYLISNFFIARGSEDSVGLFGSASGAAINNVSIVSDGVTGRDSVGGLAGFVDSSTAITNSYFTGSVTGTDFIGGLVGESSSSTITNSYATGSVTGGEAVGGLLGYSDGGTITNSYATGSVTGDYSVGGLTGGADGGTITNSYATGSVTGTDFIGGLVGESSSSTITNSYWDIFSTGRATSAGGEGVSSGANLEKSGDDYIDTDNSNNLVFVNWDFGPDYDNPWVWEGDYTWPTLYWE